MLFSFSPLAVAWIYKIYWITLTLSHFTIYPGAARTFWWLNLSWKPQRVLLLHRDSWFSGFNHSAMHLCFLERSDGGDCHLGTAHSNTAQGRYSFFYKPHCFACIRLFQSR